MARYFCRLCFNSRNWTRPTGDAEEGANTHYGNFGFAYEEWNFDFGMVIDNWKHGWIEGFWTHPDPNTNKLRAKQGRRVVPYGVHDVILYTKRDTGYYYIGRIRECNHLSQRPPEFTYPADMIAAMAAQANAAGADIRTITTSKWVAYPIRSASDWEPYPFDVVPNMRFRPESFQSLDWIPVTLPKYDRYGPLVVDGYPDRERAWDVLDQ